MPKHLPPSKSCSNASAPVNIDQGTADVDVDLGKNDRLHGYFALQQDLRQEPTLQGNTLAGWGELASHAARS